LKRLTGAVNDLSYDETVLGDGNFYLYVLGGVMECDKNERISRAAVEVWYLLWLYNEDLSHPNADKTVRD
jgi:hypothetical protein